MKKSITIMGASVLGAAAIMSANAQSAQVGTAVSGEHMKMGAGINMKMGHKGMHDGKGLDNLASVLGVSTSTLKTRLDGGESLGAIIVSLGKSTSTVKTQMDALHLADMKTRLAAQVAAGKITQAQADAMIANAPEKGMGGGMGMMGKGMGMKNGMMYDLATVLGVSTSSIKASHDAGKTIDQIIVAAGKDPATVKAQLQAAHKSQMDAKLAADVAAGKMTQVQADEIKAHKNDKGMREGMGMHKKEKREQGEVGTSKFKSAWQTLKSRVTGTTTTTQ